MPSGLLHYAARLNLGVRPALKMMDSLSQIDPQLARWASKHRLELLSFDGSRCVYIGSGHDCCQIWLAGPLTEQVAIHASDVESLDDAELDFSVSVAPADLEIGLEAALAQVELWFARPGAQA